jgi:gliding motility-associated-like protein
LESESRNYCDEELETDNYLNRHNYYWAGSGGSVGGIDGVYATGDVDTLSIRIAKSTNGFLNDCGKDSAVIRIFFPPVMELPPGAIVLINGDTASYTYSNRRLTIFTDTVRATISVPVELSCDPNSGGGGVQTACTFCLGSGLPRYRLRVEMDYLCDDDCLGDIPLACFQSGEFFSLCDPDAKGIVSEGKFVIDDMVMLRQTLGYTDSTKTQKVARDGDNLDLSSVMTFDTFNLHIPFDIRCDANYTNLRFTLAQNSIIRFFNGQRDTAKYFDFIGDTIKFYDAETNRWSTCVNALSQEVFVRQTNGFFNSYIQDVNLNSLNCLRGRFSSPDSLIIIVTGVVKDEIRTNVQQLRIRGNLTYTQDGCSQEDDAQILFNAYSGQPHGGFITIDQPYRRDTNSNRFYTEFSLCGTFELNTLMDNYYYNVDTIDPFYNEYRNPYIIDEIVWRIPDFFALDSLPFNYIRQSFTNNKGAGFQDTLKRPYTVGQIPGYHLVRMDLSDLDHFYAIRHLFRMDLIPECYGTFNDSIFVEKKVRYHLHGRPTQYKDTLIRQFYPIFVRSVEPQIDNPRQQFLFDNKSVTSFSISVPTENYLPPQYWDHHYTWLTLDLARDRYVLDSLIETTDSVRTVVNYRILPDGRYLFELDTTEKRREFELYGTIGDCGPDTINMALGSKCSAYPMDWSDPAEGCDLYLERRQIFLRPEVPNLIAQFVDHPDSTEHAPCDTFFYRAQIRNTSLGHLDSTQISLDDVPGLNLIEARLEYPDSAFIVLPAPMQVGQQLVWNIDQVFDSTGFRGFFDPDLNEFYVELTFSGDCDIQDGVFVSLQASGIDLCGNEVTSGRARTPALQFSKDSLIGQGDLYDVKFAFEGDTLCGDVFTMRATLTSLDGQTSADGQRIAVFFANELSFIPASFNAITPSDLSLGSFRRLEAQEVIYVDVPTGISAGDSLVFEAEFERTCIGLCKPTELALEVLTPQPIGCPGSPGGSCNILLKSQVWEEDSLVIAPEYAVLNARGEIVRTGSIEEARMSFDVINYSRFSVNTTLIVDFYSDMNGNGRIDTGDNLLQSVPINSPKIENAGVASFTATIQLPPGAPCQLMAALSPENNPCLCQGNTLALPPLDIRPQSGRTRDCFSNSTEVGFDPLQGYTYQWLSNGLADPNEARTTFDRQSATPKGGTSGDTLFLMSSRSGGCEAIDTFFIEWYRPQIEAQQMDSIRCYGEETASAVAQLNFAEGPVEYSWDAGQNSAMATGLGQGTYTVIGRDTNFCADTVSIVIDQPDSLEYQLDLTSDYNGYPVRCHGDQNGWVTFNVRGGTPTYRIVSNDVPQPLDTLRDLGAGWTTYRIEDKYGCWIEDSVFLDQPQPITSGTDATTAGCDEENGADAWALAMGGVPPYNYTWSNGAIGDTIGPISEGEYTVEITDENGCISYDTVEVDRLPDPVLFVNLTDTTVDYGKTIRILASSNADSGIFIWYPTENVSCDTCSNTFVTPTENMIIQVKVVDKYGCEAWEDIAIRVSVTKRVWAPNVFTPDGNNVNDGFTLFGNPTLERIEMLAIYDRWGENVFLKEDFEPGVPEEGWDGLLNGTEMNPAVFAWIARVRFFDGEVRWLSGDVTLAR